MRHSHKTGKKCHFEQNEIWHFCKEHRAALIWYQNQVHTPGGGYSTLSWVRMCGPKFRPPPYNKTREDANLLPTSKPFISWRTLFKTNQCFLQCKLGCISTFWQPIDKPKDKFIGNYAFCKNATYIKTNFQIKKGPLQNLRAQKSTLSGLHIPVPTFPLSTPPPRVHTATFWDPFEYDTLGQFTWFFWKCDFEKSAFKYSLFKAAQ